MDPQKPHPNRFLDIYIKNSTSRQKCKFPWDKLRQRGDDIIHPAAAGQGALGQVHPSAYVHMCAYIYIYGYVSNMAPQTKQVSWFPFTSTHQEPQQNSHTHRATRGTPKSRCRKLSTSPSLLFPLLFSPFSSLPFSPCSLPPSLLFPLLSFRLPLWPGRPLPPGPEPLPSGHAQWGEGVYGDPQLIARCSLWGSFEASKKKQETTVKRKDPAN